MATVTESSESHQVDDDVRQFVTFDVEDERFAVPMESVLEIIRVPDTVSVPLTSRALVGLANLRGAVLPVLEARRLMGLPDLEHTDASRTLVVDCGVPVGIVVDRVDRVVRIESHRIEAGDEVRATVRADLISGVVRGGSDNDESLLQLLDVNRVVGTEFAAMLARRRSAGAGPIGAGARAEATGNDVDGVDSDGDSQQLVSFLVDGEEYALPIAGVAEIVRVPADITRVPGTEPHVLGLINLRDRLLPLVDLRQLFGRSSIERQDRHRVVVTHFDHGGRTLWAGIVVDEVREVLRVQNLDVASLPSLLTRHRDMDEFSGVCRLDDGERLVSIVQVEALFGHPAVRQALEAAEEQAIRTEDTTVEASTASGSAEERQFVIFKLDGAEYGAGLESVSEIIRVPEKLVRVPKTPDFIEGLVNLRGSVLPTIDMRPRLGLPRVEHSDKHRILVLELDGTRTGFVVDMVSEVVRIPTSTIELPPEMSAEQAKLIPGVANLRDEGRMILLLDVQQLLSTTERSELEAVAS